LTFSPAIHVHQNGTIHRDCWSDAVLTVSFIGIAETLKPDLRSILGLHFTFHPFRDRNYLSRMPMNSAPMLIPIVSGWVLPPLTQYLTAKKVLRPDSGDQWQYQSICKRQTNPS
jgi:hypothetical protein